MAHRTTELVKEFARCGHEVVVYAVLGKYNYEDFEKNNNIRVKPIVIKSQIKPYTSDGISSRTFIDKVLGRLFGKLLEFPYIEFKSIVPKIIDNEKDVDLLISIGDPHHIHWGCAKSKLNNPKTFPKKWIADCGDPFMENGSTKSHFNYFAKNEKLFGNLCDYITVPHEGAKAGYYPEFREKIRVIPQGFEFDLLEEGKIPVENKVITFAYTGVFLKDIRNPRLFLDYLVTLDQDFKFVVYTPYTDLILSYKEKLGDKLELRSVVKRSELLKVLKTMDFLVNIENLNSPTALPSKLIDYAICKRPILSINPENINKKNIDCFLNKDYTNQFIVKKIDQYHISNVAQRFIDLKNN